MKGLPWLLILLLALVFLPWTNEATKEASKREVQPLKQASIARSSLTGPVNPSRRSVTRGENQYQERKRRSKKKRKALKKEAEAEERKQILLKLKEELEQKKIKTKFMNKAFASNKFTSKLVERLVKKAQKKILKKLQRSKKKSSRSSRKRSRVYNAAGLKVGKAAHRIKSYQSSRIRGSLNPCPQGQTRVKGRCKCPYLSSWNEAQNKCKCIYGTYKDQNGNCRSFL